METFTGAQTTYQIAYHVVWGVKYGTHILNNEMKKKLSELVKDVCEAYEFHYYCVGIAPNHVHLFVGALPKVAPARVVQVVKSITAREMYKWYPQIRRRLWGGEVWKNGYYVGTVGEGQTEEKVRSYIARQEKCDEKSIKQLKLFY